MSVHVLPHVEFPRHSPQGSMQQHYGKLTNAGPWAGGCSREKKHCTGNSSEGAPVTELLSVGPGESRGNRL